MEPLKTCEKCRLPKTLDCFDQFKEWRFRACRDCRNVEQDDRRRQKKLRKQEYMRGYQSRNSEFLHSVKCRPCRDCGRRFPSAVMEFDHIDPTCKTRNVAGLTSFGRERIEAEIAKCDVVCANCHRIRTYYTRPGLPVPALQDSVEDSVVAASTFGP